MEESYDDLPKRQENETDYLDKDTENYREKLSEKPFI